MFSKATKRQARGRMALCGPSGSGKTYTALRVAQALKGEGRIAVIDSERGSASKYADDFDFDVEELDDFGPDKYVKAIEEAERKGFTVCIIDSLSHAWEGTGGVLEQHDDETRRSRSHNSFMAWRDITPIHNRLVTALTGSSMHIIGTMRSKTEYVLETNDKGQQVPKRVGMKPIQRAGIEYEFDCVIDLDLELRAMVGKTRCKALTQKVFHMAGESDLGAIFNEWLTDGAPALFGDAERHRMRDAIQDRLKELSMSLGETADVGRSIIEALGYNESKEVPVEKLSEALELIGKWGAGS